MFELSWTLLFPSYSPSLYQGDSRSQNRTLLKWIPTRDAIKEKHKEIPQQKTTIREMHEAKVMWKMFKRKNRMNIWIVWCDIMSPKKGASTKPGCSMGVVNTFLQTYSGDNLKETSVMDTLSLSQDSSLTMDNATIRLKEVLPWHRANSTFTNHKPIWKPKPN